MISRLTELWYYWASSGAASEPPLGQLALISSQFSDAVVKHDPVTRSDLGSVVGAGGGTGPRSLFFDGVDVWVWEGSLRQILQLTGFSSTIRNVYDISGNADLNTLVSLSGGWVDPVAKAIYACDYAQQHIVRLEAPFQVTTDVVLDLSGSADQITGFAFMPNGDLIVCDWTNYDLHRYAGFSDTVVDTVDIGSTFGRLFGLSVDALGNVWLMCQGAGGGDSARYRVYAGFSGTLIDEFEQEDAGSLWDQEPNGIAAPGVHIAAIRAGFAMAGGTGQARRLRAMGV